MRIKFLIISVILIACHKSSDSDDCFENVNTERKITNANATVFKIQDEFFIVEQGTIDTRLSPCNLSSEFQIDKLKVVVSGDVKIIKQNNPIQICCTEHLFIRDIKNY